MFPASAGPATDIGWEVWPRAIYDLLMRITRDYQRPAIEITESGCAYNDGLDHDGMVHDNRRIEYHRAYLTNVARAIQEGADVRGYHAWTLIDNFEWSEGYGQRFGLVHVDFATQKRTIKESGKWYADVALTMRWLSLSHNQFAILNPDTPDVVGKFEPVALFREFLLQSIVHQ
jgi:beta-glucosidase